MRTFLNLMAVGAIAGITFSNTAIARATELDSTQSQSSVSSNQTQATTPSPAVNQPTGVTQNSSKPSESQNSSASTNQAQTTTTSSPAVTQNSSKTSELQNSSTTNQAQTTTTPPVINRPNQSTPTQQPGVANPSGNTQTPTQSQTTSAPEYLNPNPNPLLFPTKPEEVKIQRQEAITLQQALELARRNNRDLQVAILTLQRSQAGLQEANAAQFPSLNFTTDITRTDSASSNLSNARQELLQADLPIAFRNPPQDTISRTFNSTLGLTYDIYTSGRRSATIKAAEEQVRFDELEVERRAEQLRLDVSNAYYDLQQADEQVRIAQAAVTNSARNLSDAEALERAGLGTRFDVLRARVQLANSTQDLVQAQSQQRIARRNLAQFLSLPSTFEPTAADPIREAGVWNLTLEDSIVLALRNRAELEQQLAQRNISDQQRRIALSANRPQVSVFANYNVLAAFGDNVGPADGYSVGARLNWNFFDGGAAIARARQQQFNQAIAETQFANNRNQIRFQVEQAYSQLTANAENIQTTSVAVTEAEESLRLANLRFRAGVGTQTDVINAETELTRARVNQLQAIIGYNRAFASLQRAVSNLPDGNLINVP